VIVPLSLVMLGSHLVLAAADEMPVFDVRPTCSAVTNVGAPGPRDENVCIREEEDARDQLRQKWSSFPVADRQGCVSLTKGAGVPSYVEVLTCLEMAQQARDISRQSKDPADATTGVGPISK
jgi:hypothetical protein